MKKIFFSAAVLLSAVAGYTCYNNVSESDDELSDLAKANLEALANVNAEQPCYLERTLWTCNPENEGDMCYCGMDYCEF